MEIVFEKDYKEKNFEVELGDLIISESDGREYLVIENTSLGYNENAFPYLLVDLKNYTAYAKYANLEELSKCTWIKKVIKNDKLRLIVSR